MITIHINHKPRNIESSDSLELVLENLNISKQGIAVAINDQIITKAIWPKTTLTANDKITIIQTTQGG